MSTNPLNPTPAANFSIPTIGTYRARQAETAARKQAKQAADADPETVAKRVARAAALAAGRDLVEAESRRYKIEAAVQRFAHIQGKIDEAILVFADLLPHVPFLTGHVAPATSAKGRSAK